MNAKLLKEKINQRGIKQRWLANKLDVSETLVSQWLKGERDIMPRHQLGLKRLLN